MTINQYIDILSAVFITISLGFLIVLICALFYLGYKEICPVKKQRKK